MSIVTRTGDFGTTALMYNRRVTKAHPRVESYGAVDELNAALGMARATAANEAEHQQLLAIQKDLVMLMGELATATEDIERYRKDGFPRLALEHTAKLDQWVTELETREITFKGWAMPGENVHSAALEIARTVCRRAERKICGLSEGGGLQNGEIVVYLNRLSDLLWLMARAAEGSPATP